MFAPKGRLEWGHGLARGAPSFLSSVLSIELFKNPCEKFLVNISVKIVQVELSVESFLKLCCL
jgi:hypothetical protein